MKDVKDMEINRITLGGFRNISRIDLSFENITALVGLNGYGKSNVMDAIDFGVKKRKEESKIISLNSRLK